MADRKQKTRNMKRRLAAAGVTSEGLAVLDTDVLLASDAVPVSFESREDREPSYSGEAYTGGDVLQKGFKYPIVVDVKGVKIATDPQPSLFAHDANDPVGHHTPFVLQNSLRVENGVFSVPGPSTDKVIAAARRRFPWQMSIRGRMTKIRFLRPGKRETINDREVVGPRFIADEFLWRETTFTGLGADQGSPEAEIAATQAALTEGTEMSDKTPAAGDAANEEVAAAADNTSAADAQKAAELAASAAEGAKEAAESVAKTASELAASAKQADGNTKNKEELEASDDGDPEIPSAADLAAAAYIEKQNHIAMVEEVFGDTEGCATLKASAVKECWDKSRCESELKAMAETNKAPDGFVARDIEATMNMQDTLACSLAIAAGVPEDSEALSSYHDDVRDLACSAEYRNQSWHSIIHYAAKAAGRPLNFTAGGDSILKAAEELDRQASVRAALGELAASGGQGWSTLDIGSLTEDVMNKVLYSQFKMYGSVLDKIAKTGNAKDMRPHYKYRVNGGGFMEGLAATGEITHKAFSQTKFQNSVDTKAVMVSVPRDAIINDDLGVFNQIGEQFGRGAAKTLERDLFTALYDALTWDATNRITGAGSAFGVEALDAAMDLYVNQQDTDGTPIDVQPSILLVQSGSMYRQAKSIVNGGAVQLKDGITKTELAENTQKDIVDDVIHSPWLKNSSVTGASSTAWFLLCNPRELPVLEVLFLNGRRTPVVERGDTTFNTLGAQWRAYFDYGIASVNDIGIVFNAGA